MTNSRIKEHPLKKKYGSFYYRGIQVNKTCGAYIVGRDNPQTVHTEEQVDHIINQMENNLSQSIKNKNDGGMNCQNTDEKI